MKTKRIFYPVTIYERAFPRNVTGIIEAWEHKGSKVVNRENGSSLTRDQFDTYMEGAEKMGLKFTIKMQK